MNSDELPIKPETTDGAPGDCLPIPSDHIKTEQGDEAAVSGCSLTEHCFKCSFHGCPFTTTSLQLHKDHKKRHILKGRRKCLYCSFSSNKQSALTWHLLHHVEAQNTKPPNVSKKEDVAAAFYCSFPWCSFATQTHGLLKRHKAKHSHTQSSKRANVLKAHLKQHVQISRRQYLQCPKCPFKKRRSQKSMFLRHFQRHSATALGTKCSFCTYKTTVKGIKIHELIHLDRKVRLKRDWCSMMKSKLLLRRLKPQKNKNSVLPEGSNDVNSLVAAEQSGKTTRCGQSNSVETGEPNGASPAQDGTSIQITASCSELSSKTGEKSAPTGQQQSNQSPDDQDSNNQSFTITITTSQACNNADLIKQALVSEILKKFDAGKSSAVDSSCNSAIDTVEDQTESCIEASPVHNESLFSNEFEMFTDFTQDSQSESKAFMEFSSPRSSEENCLEELISNDCHSLFEVSTGADQIGNLEVDGWGVAGGPQTVAPRKAADFPKAPEDSEVIIVIDSDEENQSENNQRKVVKAKKQLVERRVQPQKTSPREIFACNHCPSKFLIKSQLAIHNMLHIARAGLKCPLCSYTNNKTSLLKHLMCHVVTDGGLFKCPLCDTTKRNIEYMNDHFKVVHSGHIFQPHEDVCRRRFCSGCCGKLLLNNTGVKAKYRFI